LTLRGRLAASVHRAAVRLKSSIKKNKKAYAFLQRLRQRRQAPGMSTTPDTDSD
jgi:CelD/BcsL family acetyltransferase involved in cellulose biosynthesis